jgi:hypothetical protein
MNATLVVHQLQARGVTQQRFDEWRCRVYVWGQAFKVACGSGVQWRYSLFLESGVHMLPDTPLFLAFVGASLVLALTPGPAVVYIVARTLGPGSRLRIRFRAGRGTRQPRQCRGGRTRAGSSVRSVLSGLQLREAGRRRVSRIPRHPVWRAAPAVPAATPPALVQPLGRVFRDGFLVALLNPKSGAARGVGQPARGHVLHRPGCAHAMGTRPTR